VLEPMGQSSFFQFQGVKLGTAGTVSHFSPCPSLFFLFRVDFQGLSGDDRLEVSLLNMAVLPFQYKFSIFLLISLVVRAMDRPPVRVMTLFPPLSPFLRRSEPFAKNPQPARRAEEKKIDFLEGLHS